MRSNPLNDLGHRRALIAGSTPAPNTESPRARTETITNAV